MAVATSDAVMALISGTTTTRRSWVSFSMSALPSISTAAFTPFICRLLVEATPWSISMSPRTKSNAKPSLNTSRKSSERRRGRDCRLRTLSSLARPGSAFRNCPDSMLMLICPAMVRKSGLNGAPIQPTCPSMRPLPRRTTLTMPNRASRSPESRMSSLKFSAVRRSGLRGSATPRARLSKAQLPVAVRLASGVVMLNLPRRHSRWAPSALRFWASISMRPSLRPRSSKSSTTTSTAGSEPGCSASRFSTCVASLCGMLRRDRRANRRPLPMSPAAGWRNST